MVDNNLLRQEAAADEPRFGMLETIREYGLEQLAAAGEDAVLRERHARSMADLAERAEPELKGPRQALWLARLDAEHENVRAALAVYQGDNARAGPCFEESLSLCRALDDVAGQAAALNGLAVVARA